MFSSFVDEMLKIAEASGRKPATLPRLLYLQEKLSPLEGSNEPSRLRYLLAKSKGQIAKNDEQDSSLLGDGDTGIGASGEGALSKIGALAGDLRRNGLGGVKRPPFPRTVA